MRDWSPLPPPPAAVHWSTYTVKILNVVSLQYLLTHGLHQPCVPAWQYCPTTATAGSSWHPQTGDLSPRPAAGRWSSTSAPARSAARRGTAAALQTRGRETRVQVWPESVFAPGVGRLAPSRRTPHVNVPFLSRHRFFLACWTVCLRPLCWSNVYLAVMEPSTRQ